MIMMVDKICTFSSSDFQTITQPWWAIKCFSKYGRQIKLIKSDKRKIATYYLGTDIIT